MTQEQTMYFVLALVFAPVVVVLIVHAACGGFSKTYPADFIPSRRFREGKTTNPEG